MIDGCVPCLVALVLIGVLLLDASHAPTCMGLMELVLEGTHTYTRSVLCHCLHRVPHTGQGGRHCQLSRAGFCSSRPGCLWI
jgi:hypothetical protein